MSDNQPAPEQMPATERPRCCSLEIAIQDDPIFEGKKLVCGQCGQTWFYHFVGGWKTIPVSTTADLVSPPGELIGREAAIRAVTLPHPVTKADSCDEHAVSFDQGFNHAIGFAQEQLRNLPSVPATTVDAEWQTALDDLRDVLEYVRNDTSYAKGLRLVDAISKHLAAAPADEVELVSAEYEKGFEDGAAFTLATLKENMGHLDTRTAGADYFHCHLCGIVKPHDGWKKRCPQVLPEITMRAAAPADAGEAMKAALMEIAGGYHMDTCSKLLADLACDCHVATARIALESITLVPGESSV